MKTVVGKMRVGEIRCRQSEKTPLLHKMIAPTVNKPMLSISSCLGNEQLLLQLKKTAHVAILSSTSTSKRFYCSTDKIDGRSNFVNECKMQFEWADEPTSFYCALV